MENNNTTNPFVQPDQDGQQTKKRSRTIGIAVVVIALVLVVAAATVAVILIKKNKNESSKQKSDTPNGAAKIYAESLYDKNGFEKYTKITMLDDAFKEYKKTDNFEDDRDKNKDLIEDLKDNKVKINIKSITKGNELSKKELMGAASYFERQADYWDVDEDVVIDKGYEYKIKAAVVDDGDTTTNTIKICVVRVKGDGWKVININAGDLYSYYND